MSDLDLDWNDIKRHGFEVDINLTALKDIDTWFDEKPKPKTEWVYECGHLVHKEEGYVAEPYCPVCGMKLIEKEMTQ